jgi:hypothetical protein
MSSVEIHHESPAAAAGQEETVVCVVEEEKSNKKQKTEPSDMDSVLWQEYILGIEDRPVALWKKRPPLFEERIRATNQHSFLDIIQELCNTVIRKRRCSHANDDDDGSDADSNADEDDDEDDCGIEDHLWELKMYSADYKPFDPLYHDHDDDDEDEEPAGIRVARELEGDALHHADYSRFRTISPRTLLSEHVLPLGHVGTFQYDFSRTTKVYLKVLSVRTAPGQKEEGEKGDVVNSNNNKDSLFGYFVEAGDQTSNERDIFSMPAYHPRCLRPAGCAAGGAGPSQDKSERLRKYR